MKKSTEALAFLLLLVLGLAPRLVFISGFPIIPVSDFNTEVEFAKYLHSHGLISNVWYWDHFNPGFPLALCFLFYLFPGQDPVTVARLATTLLGGLLPILPFLIWRGVLPLWVRMLAGAALALWPGHILFSGTASHDTWVIFPSVALAVLAVRSLLAKEPPRALTAGLLYAAAVATRQEMLVVLFPCFLGAVRGGLRISWRRAIAASLAAGLPLLALATYRYAATGRFSLRSPNSGHSILGSYVPGATSNGWIDPYAYFASVRPDLLADRHTVFPACQRLALQEALRRPAYHAVRILSSVFSAALAGEGGGLYWALAAAGTLPEPVRDRGMALYIRAQAPLELEMLVIHGFFLASLIIGIRRRNMAILVLASAVLLKYGFHGVTVMQGRYVFPATALEILTIALGVYEIRAMVPARRRLAAQALALGVAFSVGLFLYAPPLAAFVHSRDIYEQRTYRFVLEPYPPARNPNTAFACVVDQGVLEALIWPLHPSTGIWSATIRTLQENPAPGEKAVAACELTGAGEPQPMMLQVLDPYAPGGLPGRMLQRVELDGVEVYSHDIAEAPWSGWANIPLGNVGAGTKRKVVIEVKAIHPDPGADWGGAARTTFRVIESSYVSHLALGKAATQSSTLSDYATTGARVAVDGATDGNFFDGAVTHTNVDPYAWWQVDLGASVPVRSIVIWNRTDCCSDRLSDYWVFVSNTPFRPTDTPATLERRPGTWSSHQTATPHPSVKIAASGAPGRYVRVQLSGTNPLSLAEVQVFGQ